MKSSLLLLFSLMLSCSFLAAQDMEFTVSPVTVEGVNPNDFEGVGYSGVLNTAQIGRDLRWTLNVIEATPGWAFAVCDINLCYSSSVTTEDFSLDADSTGRMDVHAYPGGVEGCAIVEITVVDLADETQAISNLYYFNECATSTTEVNAQPIEVYPNPSDGLFTVEEGRLVERVEVLSITGQSLKSFNYNEGNWYDISDLPKGIYLVRLIDRDARQLVTKLINKL